MPRLYLFAEGQTELTFASLILTPHLAAVGVYLHPPVLIAHAKKKGIVHRGGGRAYEPMKNDIQRFLAQEQGNDVFFTTMIDLYALPATFPGIKDNENLRHLPRERIKALEQAFATNIGDSRFIPYIQLHEYEAYLFSDPTQFEFFYAQHNNEIEALKAIADAHDSPELINEGQHSAPSKRIIAQLPGYASAKCSEGPQVAELIGLAVIREKCPHFAAWLSQIEQLGEGLS